jgi:hypothetical protein
MSDPERTNLPINCLHAEWLIRHDIDPLTELEYLPSDPETSRAIGRMRAMNEVAHKRGVLRSLRKKGR